MKPKLANPTDSQINAAVAEYVAGWTNDGTHWGWHKGPDIKRACDLDDYATSADAVLPLLENGLSVSCVFGGFSFQWTVSVSNRIGKADALARAACIALLRAHGVEVEFTP
jgi:hypothetical protein